MKKIINILFIVVWVFMASSFAYLAYDANRLGQKKLAIYSPVIPKSANLVTTYSLSGEKPKFTIPEIINELATSHNKNVKLLEESIHESAKTSFYINLLSCFFSLFGLFAQIFTYAHDRERQ
jgi:hypothetical protein